MNPSKPESNLSHNFKIFAGGVSCVLSACWNSVAVRPAQSVWKLLSGQPPKNQGSFTSDIMGPQ